MEVIKGKILVVDDEEVVRQYLDKVLTKMGHSVELVADGKAYRQFLKPGEAPEATFNIDAEQVTAREYCNLHGLWKG